MVTWLNGNRKGHDLITKRTSDLFFDGLSKFAGCFFLLFIFLFFFLFLLFVLGFFLLVFLFLFLLLFLLFIFFLLLFFNSGEILKSKSYCLIHRHFACSKEPNLIKMLYLNCFSLSDFFGPYKGSIRTVIGYLDRFWLFDYFTVFSTETFVINADNTVSVSADNNLSLRKGVGGELGICKRDKASPGIGVIKRYSLCFFQWHQNFISWWSCTAL